MGEKRSETLIKVAILAFLTLIISLAIAFAMKAQCRTREQVLDGRQWTHNCYSDITALYQARAPKFRTEPYRPFSANGVAYRDNNFEYPPFTGLVVSTASKLAPSGNGLAFVRLNMLALSGFAFLGAAALAFVLRSRRVLLYTAMPAMSAYAYLNWDLLAVGLTALGLAAFTRRRDMLAGSALGLAAAAKLFPAFFVPVLILARLRESRSAERFESGSSWRLLAGAAAAFTTPNLIVLKLAGFEGWSFPWKFHLDRGPNIETHWAIVRHHMSRLTDGENFWAGNGFVELAGRVSLLVMLTALAFIVGREWRRSTFRPLTVCLAVSVVLLLTSIVYSPQYSLWLLPLLALVQLPWKPIVAYAIADMFVLGSIWSFFLHHSTYEGSPYMILQVAVLLRYAALVYLLIVALRTASDATHPRREGERFDLRSDIAFTDPDDAARVHFERRSRSIRSDGSASTPL